MMKEGDVILTPVPQADGTIKTRPAAILREMPPHKDFLVCGVSTQLHQQVKDFDEVISSSDPDFTSSGLKSESLVRLAFLAVLPSSRIAGSIGSIAAARHKKLLKTLSDYLVRLVWITPPADAVNEALCFLIRITKENKPTSREPGSRR